MEFSFITNPIIFWVILWHGIEYYQGAKAQHVCCCIATVYLSILGSSHSIVNAKVQSFDLILHHACRVISNAWNLNTLLFKLVCKFTLVDFLISFVQPINPSLKKLLGLRIRRSWIRIFLFNKSNYFLTNFATWDRLLSGCKITLSCWSLLCDRLSFNTRLKMH